MATEIWLFKYGGKHCSISINLWTIKWLDAELNLNWLDMIDFAHANDYVINWYLTFPLVLVVLFDLIWFNLQIWVLYKYLTFDWMWKCLYNDTNWLTNFFQPTKNSDPTNNQPTVQYQNPKKEFYLELISSSE